MSPITMLANFLANIQTELKVVVTGLAFVAVILLAMKTIKDNQQTGQINVGGLVGGLVGTALLWFIAFNARDILCWVLDKMGQPCP